MLFQSNTGRPRVAGSLGPTCCNEFTVSTCADTLVLLEKHREMKSIGPLYHLLISAPDGHDIVPEHPQKSTERENEAHEANDGAGCCKLVLARGGTDLIAHLIILLASAICTRISR